jgi:hypothetical protein
VRYVSGGLAILYREAVTGLSPGWRLCGTLGIDDKNRVALKERKNGSEEGVLKFVCVITVPGVPGAPAVPGCEPHLFRIALGNDRGNAACNSAAPNTLFRY